MFRSSAKNLIVLLSLTLSTLTSTLSQAANINIGESTTLESLINQTNTVDYDELKFINWTSFGGLGITPQNTIITKLEDFKLNIQTSSPGFSLIGFEAVPSNAFELTNLTLLDDSPGLETVTALGDLENTSISNNPILTPTGTSILAGFNSFSGGTIGFDFNMNPIVAVPETTYLSTGAIAVIMALMFRRKRS